MPTPPTIATLATALSPGAIAIVQVTGPDAGRIVAELCGSAPSPRSRLVEIPGVDEALVVRLRDDWIQLMPHGGVRLVQTLMQKLEQLGAGLEPPTPRELYPEAGSELEADMLAALAAAASPAAIDRLLEQPRLWREAVGRGSLDIAAIEKQTTALDRLITPPTVVLAGRPNVGKSTLSNYVMGRSASITADLPGTTRDWVAGLAELRTPMGELAVRWFDTPGLHDSSDPIEQRAIELARNVVRDADVLIAVRDPSTEFLADDELPRRADVYVVNKCDVEARIADRGTRNGAAGESFRAPSSALRVSALAGTGIDDVAAAIAASLGLADLPGAGAWAFSGRLKAMLRGANAGELADYIGIWRFADGGWQG
jgi:tRNA modification GTPase